MPLNLSNLITNCRKPRSSSSARRNNKSSVMNFLNVKQPGVYFLPHGAVTVLDFESPSTPEYRVVHALLSKAPNTNAVALVGMIGCGKSALVHGLTSRKQLWPRFRDAIWFVDIGEFKTVQSLFQHFDYFIDKLLPTWYPKYDSLVQSKTDPIVIANELGKKFLTKRMLLIFDQVSDLKPDLYAVVTRLCSYARSTNRTSFKVLSTTRQLKFASLPYHDISIDMNPPRAVSPRSQKQIACKYCGLDIDTLQTLPLAVQNAVDDVVAMTDGLPLALAKSGSGALMYMDHSNRPQRFRSWIYFRETMQDSLAQLTERLSIGHEGMLQSVLDVSTLLGERLDDEQIQFAWMVRSFGVFPTKKCIPLRVLQMYWQVPLDCVHAVLGILEENNLAWKVVDSENNSIGLRLHRIMHEACIRLAERKDGLQYWHERIVNAYVSQSDELAYNEDRPVRPWWDVARSEVHPQYIGANIIRHFVGAGKSRESFGLLLDYRWIEYANSDETRRAFEYVMSDIAILRDYVDRKGNAQSRRRVLQDLDTISNSMHVATVPYCLNNRNECTFQLYARLASLRLEQGNVHRLLWSLEKYAVSPWIRAIPGMLVNEKDDLRRVLRTNAAVSSVEIGYDTSELLIGGRDGHVRVISCQDGTEKMALDGDGELVGIRHHKEKEEVYSCYQDGRIVVRRGEAIVRTLEVPLQNTEEASNSQGAQVDRDDVAERITCIELIISREQIVCGLNNGQLKILKSEDGQVVKTLHGHEDAVTAIAKGKEEDVMITGSWDGSVRMWTIESLTQKGDAFVGQSREIECVAISNSKRTFAVGSYRTGVAIWDIEKRRELRTPQLGLNEGVFSLAYGSRDFILYVGTRQRIYAWDLRPARHYIVVLHLYSDERMNWVTNIRVNADDTEFYACSNRVEGVFVWRALNVRESELFTSNANNQFRTQPVKRAFEHSELVGISQNGQTLITCNTQSRQIVTRKADTVANDHDQILTQLRLAHDDFSIRQITISNNGQFVAYTAGNNNCIVYIADARSGGGMHRLFTLEHWAISTEEASEGMLDARSIDAVWFDAHDAQLSALCITRRSRDDTPHWSATSATWDVQSGALVGDLIMMNALDALNGRKFDAASADALRLTCKKSLHGALSHSIWLVNDQACRWNKLATLEYAPSRTLFSDVTKRLWISRKNGGVEFVDLMSRYSQRLLQEPALSLPSITTS